MLLALAAPLMDARVLALCAVTMWASLASLATAAARIPAFQALAFSFLVGGALVFAYQPVRRWRVRLIVAGCAGLLGSHAFYFMAMSLAPPAEVAVINYSWPILMVLVAPIARAPGARWSVRTVGAGALGFAAVAILAWESPNLDPGTLYGWLAAFASAVIWCGYSLANAVYPEFADYPLGPAMVLSGVASGVIQQLVGHWHAPSALEFGSLCLIGAGPMGAAFVMWGRALRFGNAQWAGVLANVSPILSVALLTLLGYAEPSARLLWAGGCIVLAGCVLGSGGRAPRDG